MKCISPVSPGQPLFLRLQMVSFTEASLHLSKRKKIQTGITNLNFADNRDIIFVKNASATFKSKTRLSP